MRVIDYVPFYNEIEILRSRVQLLRGAVDLHVVTEMDLTHQGSPKPFHLDLQSIQDEFPEVTVLSVRLRTMDDALRRGEGHEANWRRERWQRERGLGHSWLQPGARFALDPDDLVVSCDVDEIPNPQAIDRIAEMTEAGPVRLWMRMLYYGLDWEHPLGWSHAVAFRVRDMPESLSGLRLSRSLRRVVDDAGWHVSYWGGRDRRRDKLAAFAHAENSAPHIAARIDTGHVTGTGPNGERLTPVDRSTLPALLVEMLG